MIYLNSKYLEKKGEFCPTLYLTKDAAKLCGDINRAQLWVCYRLVFFFSGDLVQIQEIIKEEKCKKTLEANIVLSLLNVVSDRLMLLHDNDTKHNSKLSKGISSKTIREVH